MGFVTKMVRDTELETESQSVDRVLMTRVQGGDMEAFETLVDKYKRSVTAFCFRFVPDSNEAEDLAQATFVQVYRAAERFRLDGRFKTWLFTIARNLCLNEIRRRKSRPSESLEGITEREEAGSGVILQFRDLKTPEPEILALRNELVAIVKEAMDELPEKQRTALHLFQEQGMSYEEIGAIVGKSLSATKSLIFRAREAMKTRIKPYLVSGEWETLALGQEGGRGR